MILCGTVLHLPKNVTISGGFALVAILVLFFSILQTVVFIIWDFSLVTYVRTIFTTHSLFRKILDGGSTLGTGHDLIARNCGSRPFWFQDKKFEITVEKTKTQEKMKITTSSVNGSTDIFLMLLDDVRKYKQERSKSKTIIYTGYRGGRRQSGGEGGGRRKRPLESVILEDDVPEIILADIQDFLDNAQWYTDFGVPYRRGYLFHGPPGTGQTSFIMAIAGHFDLSICVLNLNDKDLSDTTLNQMLISAPENSIILLEYVDAAFVRRDTENVAPADGASKEAANTTSAVPENPNRLTFSGLLNALDGVAPAEGRILFMTTNYIDKLDPALIRPGRVDVKQYIGYASESQIIRMFRRFHHTANDEKCRQFCTSVLDRPERPLICLAQMQGLFQQFKQNPEQAITGISMLYEWTPRVKVFAAYSGGPRKGKGLRRRGRPARNRAAGGL